MKKKLVFRRINEGNFRRVILLSESLSPEQKRCVAPNVRSLAQAYLHRRSAWPRAVYWGEEPIGFVMLDRFPVNFPEKDLPVYFLWRLMVAAPFQGQGFGKQILDLLVDKCRKEGQKFLYTSCDREGPMPYAFYWAYGFEDTGVVEDDEAVLRLPISA
jgi:diamine N-acetyltransferase